MPTDLVRFASLLLTLGGTFAALGAGPEDWPMAGRTSTRNPVVTDGDAPLDWDVQNGKNIRWSAKLGSATYGTPVVADGHVYLGTNNGAGYLKRYPSTTDLGCLLCFRESDGEFLWQFSAEKLAAGRVHDWPLQGIGCPPLVQGDRLWLISNRWEVVCLDTQGFRDGKNDGEYDEETANHPTEADVIWKFDLIGQLGVHPHPAGMGPDRRCSIAAHGNRIYVITGNGVDESHIKLWTPHAPSLVCLDKHTGKVLWTDNSPGENILHTQISSPLVTEIAGKTQVVVPQGDGWVRSFEPDTGKLIWKFDMNSKMSEWILGGRGTRNTILATPVVYEDRIYIGNGQEWEHGDGLGRLVCLDPTKRGDMSAELGVDKNGRVIPHRRRQAVDLQRGEQAVVNPNSGLIWEFTNEGDNVEDEMHRMMSSVAVHNGLVIAADGSGLIHCLSATTGERYWVYDTMYSIWSAPLIVGETVYVPNEEGIVSIFRLSADPQRAMKPGSGLAFARGKRLNLSPIREIELDHYSRTSPIFANATLFIATDRTLYAIGTEETEKRADADEPPIKENTHSTPGPAQKQLEPNGSRVPKSAYVPTPQDVVDRMLDLANVWSNDTVCDLGSGDGRIVITAAKKYGAIGIGYEIDKTLVAQSKMNAVAAGVADRVTIHQSDLFNADLSRVDVLTLYLYPFQNRTLLPRLAKLKDGVRIVTHRYGLPGVKPQTTLSVKSSESSETHTIQMYTTPLHNLADSP